MNKIHVMVATGQQTAYLDIQVNREYSTTKTGEKNGKQV